MALPPQKFREIVYQLLFSASFDVEALESTSLMLMGELKVTKRAVRDACSRAKEVISRLDMIDEKIRAASKEYQFERISSAEKCALRLGFFEILYDATLPNKIAIAEAIRLTRKFGTPESADFVNAILDVVQKNVSQVQNSTPVEKSMILAQPCQNSLVSSSGGGENILQRVAEATPGQDAAKGRFCAAESFVTGSWD